MNLQESITMTKKWTVRRYADHAAFEAGMPTPVVDASTGELLPAISEVIGNLLLNEGIGELLDLACGLGTPTAFSNANAYIGVGDSVTAEAATQTDLQAASNKTYKAMAASYPSRSAQTVTWRAVFGSAENEAVILAADGGTRDVPRGSKTAVAHAIWDEVATRLQD